MRRDWIAALPIVLLGALLLALPAAEVAGQDLRIPVVELLAGGEPREALILTETTLAELPQAAEAAGMSYLRGRLLQALGRQAEAEEAFSDALNGPPQIDPYLRYRMAVIQERDGHPEVAAGLVASVVHPDTPPDLLGQATELFARVIAAGGDCRIVRGVRARRLPEKQDRLLRLVAAECALLDGYEEQAAEVLCGVLREKREDDPARRAADLLDEMAGRRRVLFAALDDCDAEALVALTLHHHREYDRSIPALERIVERYPERRTVAGDEELEVRYALARGYFWEEEFDTAAELFGDLVLRTRDLEERAEVLYQQARSLELAGDWNAADAVFRRSYSTYSKGLYAPAALLSAMRLEWRGGRERDALELYRLLTRDPAYAKLASRASLFLASSDIVRGRADRADAWLDSARRFDRTATLEVSYWRGRLAQLDGSPEGAEAAVEHYLDAAVENPYHPLSLDALERVHGADLAAAAARVAGRLITRGRRQGLFAAWLALGDGTVAGRAARRGLLEPVLASPAAAYFGLRPLPVEDWPLWRERLDDAPEMLLALGLVDEGATAVPRHFPAADLELGYTGSRLLFEARRVRRSILLADAWAKPLERRLEEPLRPREVRSLLHPLPWRPLIVEEAERFGVDPFLLAGVIREESRFDPDAISTVSARGLTQFVWLTARRLASELGMGTLHPRHLYRPEVAIRLGAAYLAELRAELDGAEHRVVAAYNAGPVQARLWQAYCYGGELPEYYTKTGFVQTRGYLRKVLGSRAIYTELYGGV